MSSLRNNIKLENNNYLINETKLLDIAGSAVTPMYLYDLNLVSERYKELYENIKWKKLKIYYAMKANFNKAILEHLRDEGAYLDIVSPAEVIYALSLGYSPDRLLYTANNMTDEEMDIVQAKKVLFNIGSLSRLEKYGKKYPGSKVCIRFNPDVVAGYHKKIQTGGDLTKFGILLEDINKVKDIVSEYNLKVTGLHEHTGSGIADTDKIIESMNNLLELATPGNFPDLEFVDFGGGFKVAYRPDDKQIDYSLFGKKITDLFTGFCERNRRELTMCFEPGKYIVADSGILIVRVNTIKQNRTRTIVGTDSGFPQLIRPVFYDAYHHIINLSNPDGKEEKYDICGNICETGDCFATDRVMPEIREGDYLAILNAGAYCFSMASIYNLRALPAEAVINNNEVKVVRKKQNEQELVEDLLKVYG